MQVPSGHCTKICPIFHFKLAEQARTSIDSQLKTARELNQQLEARLLEAEKEKLELQQEKMKAVESVEERVRNAHGWHIKFLLLLCVVKLLRNSFWLHNR